MKKRIIGILALVMACCPVLAGSAFSGTASDPQQMLKVAGLVATDQGKGINEAQLKVLLNGQPLEEVEQHTGPGGRFAFAFPLPAGFLPDGKAELLVSKPTFADKTIELTLNSMNAAPADLQGQASYMAYETINLNRVMNPAFWIAAIVLVLIYILIAAETMHRTLAALLGGAVLMAITYTAGTFNPDFFIISFDDAIKAIDMNVILLLMAMMIIVGVTKHTGVFQWMAYKAFEIAKGDIVRLAAILMIITAVASAFLDNVTTMLLIIPVTLEIARTLKLNSLALLMPEVFASNVGGTATLIGDPPNIMIGSYAQLSFMDFVSNLSVFCAIALVVSIFYMLWWFRKDYAQAHVDDVEGLTAKLKEDYKITNSKLLAQCLIMLGITVFLFIIHGALHMEPSIAALLGASILLVISKVDIVEMLEHEVEWPTLVFFMFLFIVVGAAEETGLIQLVADWVSNMSQGSLLVAVLLILWVSAIASAFVDNIPFTATMLPIVAYLTEVIPGAQTGVLWWTLALGACLGGNATMIGASANVVTVGLAEKAGYHISFLGYMKVAALPTIITCVMATAWVVLVEM